MKYCKIAFENKKMKVVFSAKPSPWVVQKLNMLGFLRDEERRNEWLEQNEDKEKRRRARKLLRNWEERKDNGKLGKKESDTLCWRCDRACGGCSWSRYFIPVEGWVACEENRARKFNGKVQHSKSYTVVSCPLFVDDQKVSKKC